MARKRNDPAANGVEGNAVLSESTATIAKKVAADNHPVITRIRTGPGGEKPEWFVSIEGVCIDALMRSRRLRSYKKFCNVMRFRFGVSFAPMSQAKWEAIVDAAIAEGGAA
jgi:hypothetical protein